MNVPYLPGHTPPPDIPLGRFLPPIPTGMAAKWCRTHLKPGAWVLEPFGFNPLLTIEIAAQGHPVLVTANNPIHAFLIRAFASAPDRDMLLAALQDLAISSNGDERMEPTIRQLYQINCADCGREIEADAFLWKREAEEPFATLVNCPYCGAQGEQSITPETRQSIPSMPAVGLHRARALVRIVEQNDPLRSQVENALSFYPTRALIVLQTMINKIESLAQPAQRRNLLTALMLYAADKGNTLWTYPSPRTRPRQLVVPPIYQENNLWKALEEAITQWPFLTKAQPVQNWEGQKNPDPGIFLFDGRLKELTPRPEEDFFGAIITALPRPNQAFWTLSALWTGWFWGQEAVQPIRQVLSRQRYDWNWHTNALRGVFTSVRALCAPPIHFWGLIAENEPMLLLSIFLAADSVGLPLKEIAQSQDDQLAQSLWEIKKESKPRTQPLESLALARKAMESFLIKKGEPAPYQQIHAAAISKMAKNHALALDIFQESENQFASETEKHIEILFQEQNFLERVGGGTASLETGIWWLKSPPETRIPLIDRVEKIIVRHLVKNPSTTASQLIEILYQNLPGIYTPENEIILNCLDSYANLSDIESHIWILKEEDRPENRKREIVELRTALQTMGQKLNFKVTPEKNLTWQEPGEHQAAYHFHLLGSAIITPHLIENQPGAARKIILIPKSRFNLLAYKEKRDPILKSELDQACTVVHFQVIKDLAANPLLSRDLFLEQIKTEPPEYQSSQLALF